jgi:hypothetical protein
MFFRFHVLTFLVIFAVPKKLRDLKTGEPYTGTMNPTFVDPSALEIEENEKLYFTLPQHLPVAYMEYSFKKLIQT